LLKERNAGWKTLAGMVGLGQGAMMRPIRFTGTQYRSNPIMRAEVSLSETAFEQGLAFEVVEQAGR
jgi:hypothetical protein